MAVGNLKPRSSESDSISNFINLLAGNVTGSKEVLGDNVTSAKNYILKESRWKETALGVVMASITQKEGWSSKAGAAYANNNPGNLVYSDSYKSIDPKVTKDTCCGGKFAKFSSDLLGLIALARYIKERSEITAASKAAKQICFREDYTSDVGVTYNNSKLATNRTPKCNGAQSGVPNPSIYEFFYVYAPPQDKNNPLSYAENIVKDLHKLNLPGEITTPLKDII